MLAGNTARDIEFLLRGPPISAGQAVAGSLPPCSTSNSPFSFASGEHRSPCFGEDGRGTAAGSITAGEVLSSDTAPGVGFLPRGCGTDVSLVKVRAGLATSIAIVAGTATASDIFFHCPAATGSPTLSFCFASVISLSSTFGEDCLPSRGEDPRGQGGDGGVLGMLTGVFSLSSALGDLPLPHRGEDRLERGGDGGVLVFSLSVAPVKAAASASILW
mmetsp:Transcript_25835/g.59471  ORF Transcript_25835/g.59471 Transcript_25835/m.59471 type:complete len:217 (+) Transcript_25835:643-1293(+)